MIIQVPFMITREKPREKHIGFYNLRGIDVAIEIQRKRSLFLTGRQKELHGKTGIQCEPVEPSEISKAGEKDL